MGENKKYYWLKLMNDFFTQPRIKKLRKIAGGDTYTIIYLKLQLLSLKNDGVLIFEGIEDNVIEELALTIDEDIDNVQVTFQYLIKQGLIEQIDEESYLMTETQYLIGSETASTIRSRKSREKKKMLQSNTNATNCNIEIELEKEKEEDIEKEKDINNSIDTSSTSLVDENKILNDEFETLWKNYPKKVGKPKALEKYKKYRKSKKEDYCTFEEVQAGLEKYLKYIEQNEWYRPKDGSTWFNQRCWLDEYELKEEIDDIIPTLHNVDDEQVEDELNALLDEMRRGVF